MSMRPALLTLLLFLGAHACPSIFWASQPVRPNETVLAQGCGLEGVSRVSVRPLSGGQVVNVRVEESSSAGVNFVLPPSLRWPSAYEFTAGDAPPFRLNTPDVQWLQGDAGDSSTLGGFVRAFGKCIDLSTSKPRSGALVRAQQALRTALDTRNTAEIMRLSDELHAIQASSAAP